MSSEPGSTASARGMLAVALGVPSMSAALRGIRDARAAGAEAIELRLDLFEEPYDLPRLLAAREGVPVVVTLRPPDQGGRSPLPPDERLAILLNAARRGAEFVDVEWNATTPEHLAALRAAGARVVLSRHDFGGMPDLAAWYAELADLGADAVKVVGTAWGARDALAALAILRAADRPTIAIAMGAAGLASRVLAPREPACLLTYAALGTATATAPGQVSLAVLRDDYRASSLQPFTEIFGVLGPENGLLQSTATGWNRHFHHSGRPAVAVPFLLGPDEPVAAVLEAAKALPVQGWFLEDEATRRSAIAVLDALDAAALRTGRVDRIDRLEDGSLQGRWVGGGLA